MKNLKIFAIVSVLAVLVSCNNGLTKQTDKEEGLVAFSLEFDGKTISSNNTRNIGIDSVEDALKDFVFAVNLINKQDSSKNQNMGGKINDVSLFLQYLSLAKGSWTVKIDGSIPGKDAKISGSTDFTVGGREAFFVLKLNISGDAKGSIEYNTRLGKVEENQKAILYPLEKYISGTIEDGDGIVYEYPDEANPPANAYKLYANLNPDVIVLEDVTPGKYFLQIKYEDQVMCSDVAYVYPGLTSRGIRNEGKSNLILDYGYVYQEIMGSQETKNVIEFEDGIAKLPGYGSSEDDERELMRPGYLFTGWYDSKESAKYGIYPSIPLTQKFVSQKDYSGNYMLKDQTLYAGWKPVNTDGLLEQDLYYWTGTGEGSKRVTFKGKLINNPTPDTTAPKISFTFSSKYTANGDDVYIIYDNQICYIDYSSLTEDTAVSTSTNKINFTWADGVITPENQGSYALYKDSSGNVYVLQVAKFNSQKKFYIVKLDKDTNPKCYATLDIDNGDIEFNYYDKTIEFFAISDNSVFIVYTENHDFFLEKYNLQPVENDSQEKLAGFEYVLVKDEDDEAINLATLYNPYPLVYDGGEPTGYAKIYVSDICVDGNSVYLIVDENSYTNDSYGKEEFISTGAVVEFNTNLVLQGIYGRQVEPAYLQDSNTKGNSHFVSHAYDMTAFAGPKKLLAIYKRKLVIFDEGGYPYYKDDSDSPSVTVKRWLSRVTTFDLDKKCLDYAQITNMDIIEGSSNFAANLAISGFSWDNN